MVVNAHNVDVWHIAKKCYHVNTHKTDKKKKWFPYLNRNHWNTNEKKM